jgi:hypothetical protein
MRTSTTVLLLLLAMLAWISPAHAATSSDNCTNFITSVPIIINTPGIWCLKQDLSTAQTTSSAIRIDANNVVIDCNDFIIDNLAAGKSTEAAGIFSYGQTHLTVRHCTFRGFDWGLLIETSSGDVIEDNHFTQQTLAGIDLEGDRSVVRRNLVTDIGGSTTLPQDAYGIGVEGTHSDVLDNKVIGVIATSSSPGSVLGITVGDSFGSSGTDADDTIEGNQVKGLVQLSSQGATGIFVEGSPRAAVRNNDIENGSPGTGIGIVCGAGPGQSPTRIRNNVINGFATAWSLCGDAGKNDVTH